jgi:hypothetical protein
LPRLALPEVRLVRQDRLHDLVPHRVDGVQCVHRALEDHRDLLPAGPAELVGGQPEQVPAVEEDLAAHAGVVGQKPQERERDRGLARAALADQPEDLAALDGEGRVLDGADVSRPVR